jgi:hypothetical protein
MEERDGRAGMCPCRYRPGAFDSNQMVWAGVIVAAVVLALQDSAWSTGEWQASKIASMAGTKTFKALVEAVESINCHFLPPSATAHWHVTHQQGPAMLLLLLKHLHLPDQTQRCLDALPHCQELSLYLLY